MSIFMYTVYTDLLVHRSQLNKESFEQMTEIQKERDQELKSHLQHIEFPIRETTPREDVAKIMSLLSQLSCHHSMLNFLLERKEDSNYSVIANGVMNHYSSKQDAYDSILARRG